MNDVVRVPEQRRTGLIVEDVGSLQDEVGVALVLSHIGLAPTDEIIERSDLEATVEQQVDHVTSDEAGTSGHDRVLARCIHLAPIFFIVRTL
jgi:hypothetical protein